jgi:hypothetical protein
LRAFQTELLNTDAPFLVPQKRGLRLSNSQCPLCNAPAERRGVHTLFAPSKIAGYLEFIWLLALSASREEKAVSPLRFATALQIIVARAQG